MTSTADAVGTAGGSLRAEAAACRDRAEQCAQQRKQWLERAARFEAAERGEVSVAATLHALEGYGWRVLADRQWPRSAANIDLLLVGPGGVVVVDVKRWAEPRVEAGRLYRGDADETPMLTALLDTAAGVVADALGDLGYAPAAVAVAAVLAGHRLPATEVSGAVVVGEAEVAPWLLRRGRRLATRDVDRVVGHLETAFPPHRTSGRRASRTTVAPPRPRPKPQPDTADLFDVTALADADRAAAASSPIERWMTWLHPDQAPLVTRAFHGPARLSGPAGTGKTVVALHRAALAARQPGARVLLASFVRTLPVVLGTLVGRLTDGADESVEASSVHGWARAFLRERRVHHRLDADRADTAFAQAWLAVGKRTALASLPVLPPYWQEEIEYVIKGRGIDRFEDYAALDRVGRRTPLRLEHRQAVWDVYCAYQETMAAAGRHDFADVLRLARDELRAHPLEQPYTAVVVDEVQDLTLVGVQLLHALVGDRTDGLLLVGDSTQALYPGGFRLKEAGVDVVGRSVRLGRNYRNGAAILAHVATVAATPVDLDETTSGEATDTAGAVATRDGGAVHTVTAASAPTLDQALLRRLVDTIVGGARCGDCAVLVPGNRDVGRWLGLLRGAGQPAVPLTSYDGTPVDAVKVGTVHRAKGLEFAHVVVLDTHPLPPRKSAESDEAYAERAEEWQRRLHVALTRARDTLWCGRIAGTSSARPATLSP
ncbi:UvrD-helicase domain-containing protein [Aquipuribacter sp. SD81]|uniref:UvrD-helicase domain-containing protein n=1 Tax=Aquipuribacter sp. SD81 TaxID=3127703 RepID=UPI003018873F